MITFEKYSLSALQKYAESIRTSDLLTSDVSIGSLFMWYKDFGAEFASAAGACVVKLNFFGETAFSFPLGGDSDKALDLVEEYARENDLTLSFFGVDDERLSLLKKRYPLAISRYDRKWSDYLYSFDDIYSYKGKRFSGQRNHVNKFVKTYGEPIISRIRKEDVPALYDFLNKYELEHGQVSRFEKKELNETKRLIEAYFDLPLYGVAMRYGGEIIGFSIGEIVGGSLVIHVEKALREYDGVYPTLFRGFVRFISDELGVRLQYVNREDDSGDPGLRTSKMQYHPIALVNKNFVKINSPLFGKDIPTAKGDGVVLTDIEERDKPDYLRLCADRELNAQWGYDYEDELGEGNVPDEDSFFEMQKSDRSDGICLSMAVREEEDGKMLGEAVLYNFAYSGKCEVGIRILPEYQGRGYGKKGFAAAKALAADYFGITPTAKCFKDNFKSEKAILASGMKRIGEDEKFYYFA